jgi:type VI secretion system secreted protein Hcp
VAIFMNYDGIDGDVTTQGHEKWIELNSFQWACGRNITRAKGSGANREATTPRLSEIVVGKVSCGSSLNLIRTSLGIGPTGEGTTVQIDFCKTDTTEPEPYLQMTLHNTLVSCYSASSTGDRPTETLTLNFTKMEYKNIGMGAANETGTPDVGHYDLTTETGS